MVPAGINGETSTAGTRPPNLVKSKPYSPTDVVVTAAVLVISNDQQRLVPAGAAAQCLVNLLDQHFAERHVVVGVLAVASRAPARLEEGVGGQVSGRGVGLENGELTEAGVRCLR